MAESQEKTKQPLVPMIGPDGSSALIDALEVHALMMRGAVPGVVMRAPDGRVGVVAFKNAEAAQNSGGTLLRNDGDPYPEGQTPVIVGHNGNGEPIWGTAPEPSVAGEMAKSFFGNALDAFKGAAESFNPNPNAWEQKEGLTTPYDTVMRPLERLIEGNVQEYQTAQALVDQRKYAQAFLHDLAVPVPMLGPWIDGMLENYSQHLKEGDVAGAYGGLFGNIALAATMEGVPKVAAFARDVTRGIPGRVAEHIAPEETLTQPQGQEQLSPRERAAAARRMGVNLDLAQATDAGGPRMVKRINEHSATAGPGYEQARQGNAAALEAEAQRMVHGVRDRDTNPLGAPMGREEFGHTMQQAVKRHDAELRDAPGLAKQTQELLDQADKQDMTREEFGEQARSALEGYRTKLLDQERALYEGLDERLGESSPELDLVRQKARGIFDAKKRFYEKHPEALKGGDAKVWNWVKDLAGDKSEDTWADLQAVRSHLLDITRGPEFVGDTAAGWAEQLTHAVDETMTSAEKTPGLSAKDAKDFRDANTLHRRLKETFDDNKSPFYWTQRQEGAKAAERLDGLGPQGLRDFREAMQVAKRPDLVGQQQRQAMQNLIDPTRNGEPDFAGLPARFRKLDKEQAAETFTPEQLDALGKIAAKADVETPYDKAGSQLKTLRDAPDAAAASNALFDSQGRSKLSQEEVRQLFEAAPEQMPHLQQQAVSRLLDPANNGTPDLAGLPTRWVRSNKDIAAHVMTPEQMRELDELSSVSRAAQYRSNPSGTAVSLQPAGEISGAVSGLTAGGSLAVMGHPVAGAITAAAAPAELAAQALTGKAMRSPGLVEGVMEHEKPPTLREIWKNANQRRGLVSRAGDALRPGPDSGGGGAVPTGGNGPVTPPAPIHVGEPQPIPVAPPAVAPKIETAGNAALSPQQDATAAPPSLRDKFSQQVERRNAQGQAYGVSTPPETEPLIGAPPEPNEVHDPEKEAAVLAALTPRTPKAAPSAPVAAAKAAPAGVHPGTDGTTLRTGTSTSEQMAPQMAAPEGATHEVVHPETGQVVGHMVNGEYVPLENDEENAPSAQ